MHIYEQAVDMCIYYNAYYFSGGVPLTVTGDHMDSVSQPVLNVFVVFKAKLISVFETVSHI